MVRLNRIYTKAGDGGDTRLVGGQKVRKDALRIEAYGTVDELSACLGIARTALTAPGAPAEADALARVLARIQNELFNLGSDLATLPADRHPRQPVIEARHIIALEREIDDWNAALPELRSFVLPGGGVVASYLHLARTVCRRAERHIVRLRDAETTESGPSKGPAPPAMGRGEQSSPASHAIGEHALAYVNRLSDALFVMSRHAARLYGESEPLWEPEKT